MTSKLAVVSTPHKKDQQLKEDQYSTASERREQGKALRDAVPRVAHAGLR